MEQNIGELDGLVEDVLDRNGEKGSKSCRCGVMLVALKFEDKDEEDSFSALCACM